MKFRNARFWTRWLPEFGIWVWLWNWRPCEDYLFLSRILDPQALRATSERQAASTPVSVVRRRAGGNGKMVFLVVGT